MPRPDIYTPKAEKLTRMAVLERSEKAIAAGKTTVTPPLIRLVLAAIAGIFLLLAQTGAVWAWCGAASFMLAVCGAPGLVAASGGALAAAVAGFRTFGAYDGAAVFWFVLVLNAAGGALAGALCSVISHRLPPQAYAFLAALLPAGLEHLMSWGSDGPLGSTALTQYAHPAIICMGRLGGLAGITYVIFLFGAAIAVGVRHVRSSSILITATLPPIAFVFAGLLYGAVSTASTDKAVRAAAFNFNSLEADRRPLFATANYDAKAWEAYLGKCLDKTGRVASKQITATAIELGSASEERESAPKAMQLIVMPEAAVAVDDQTRAEFSKGVEAIARNNDCCVAMSCYDTATDESSVFLTDSSSAAMAACSRRRFAAGRDDRIYGGRVATRSAAKPQIVDAPFGKAGAILSLDANRFENFASIASAGGTIVSVCGWDDGAVPQTSIRLLACNAALSGMAVVRSTRVGLMAIINPDGRIVASETASDRNDSQIAGSVRLGSGRTAFLAVGNTFAWLALLAGLGAGLYATTLPRGSDEPGGDQRARQTSALSYKTREGIKDV